MYRGNSGFGGGSSIMFNGGNFRRTRIGDREVLEDLRGDVELSQELRTPSEDSVLTEETSVKIDELNEFCKNRERPRDEIKII